MGFNSGFKGLKTDTQEYKHVAIFITPTSHSEHLFQNLHRNQM